MSLYWYGNEGQNRGYYSVIWIYADAPRPVTGGTWDNKTFTLPPNVGDSPVNAPGNTAEVLHWALVKLEVPTPFYFDWVRWDGTGGTSMANGASVWIQFSADGTAFHDAYVSGDIYIRFAVALTQPAHASSAWGPAIPFVGSSNIPDNSITPAQLQADTANQKAAMRTRLDVPSDAEASAQALAIAQARYTDAEKTKLSQLFAPAIVTHSANFVLGASSIGTTVRFIGSTANQHFTLPNIAAPVDTADIVTIINDASVDLEVRAHSTQRINGSNTFTLPSQNTIELQVVGSDDWTIISSTIDAGSANVDGVLNGASFDDSSYEITYSLSIGADIVLDLSPILTTINALTARVSALEGTPPVQSHLNYLGISADTTFDAAEFTISGTTPSLTIAGIPNGETRHIAFARPESEGAFTAIYLYAAGSRNTINQIGSWTELATTIDLGGEAHNVIYSNTAYGSVSNGFVVEAV